MVKVSRSVIPSFFTVINMFFGFFAIIQAAQGKLTYAVWLVFAGSVMDALDGKIARLANASSDFGVEYDSLADVVTFGAAPSFIIYNAFFKEIGLLGLFIAFAPLLFGSLRLARFNSQLEGHTKDCFTGLPIPTAAVAIVSFIFFEEAVWGDHSHYKMHLFVVLGVSLLMISNIRYPVLPQLKLKKDLKQMLPLIYIAVSVLLLFYKPEYFLFITSLIYILYGIIAWIFGSRVPEKKKKAHHHAQSDKKNKNT